MNEYQRQTDQVHKIDLPSAISQAVWDLPVASPGDEVEIRVYTHFVGNGSEIRVRVHNKSGRRLDELTGKVFGNRYKVLYTVSDRAEEAIYYEAELKKHGLKKKSEEMRIIPPIEITNARWSQQEARRGDILTLSADVSGVPDGTEALIEIYEHDADGAHDFITRFTTLVEDQKVEVEWEYEYYEDVDEIPTEEELERGYNPPEYFFVVMIGKRKAESGLLEFRDWIEIRLVDTDSNPVPDEEYLLHLPDGSERRGSLDGNGYAKEENIPPGRYVAIFPNRI